MTSTNLTTTNQLATASGLSVMSRIAEFQQVAKIFAESGMFSDARGQAQCFVKILAGAEIGLPPFTAMNAFHVIQGKVTMAASTIAARLKSSGKYDYTIVEKTGERCVIDFYAGGVKVWQEVWDTKRAIKAGVKNLDRFPDAMLFSRAISAGARAIAPDVVGQFYTPEEMGANVDSEGNVSGGNSASEPEQEEHAEEPAALKPVSASDRIKLSQLIDAYPDAKKEHERAGKTEAEKEKFRNAVVKMFELVNMQLAARGMAKISAKSTDTALPAISKALETMRQHDERAPLAEEPATSPAS